VIRFPFAAIIGQQKLKSAYLANIINPRIGGLLISGPKGSGKSTIVHSVQSILPEFAAVNGCVFNCDPLHPERFCSLCKERGEIHEVQRGSSIVTLPLSATEDRLIGSINVEKLLKEGKKEIQPGILGEANRNILYIDEVNLLPDHLVDDILDAAASHWNSIEREGLSVHHPADFVLVGSMNPEEGELRPQILDRFPLCVRVDSVRDPQMRVDIVRSNLFFEQDPEAFIELFREETGVLRRLILDARSRLPEVSLPEALIVAVAQACSDLKVDGQRPEIVILKTAQTLAAIHERMTVQPGDILESAIFTLVHRTRDGGLLEPPLPEEIHAAFATRLNQAPAQDASAKPERVVDFAKRIKKKP
jgi:magnesium chelatase subunit D